MRIAIIDSFFDTSHKLWAEGLKDTSRHHIDIYAGSPHHWKWKMTGGTLELAKQFVAADQTYDLLIVTDMVHLPLFKSILPPSLRDTPVLLYFHENQITYPWLDTSDQDRHYGWINYISATQADRIAFNSEYHRQSFLKALPTFLKPFPKFDWRSDYSRIQQVSDVLPIGLDLASFYNGTSPKPIFLWNHRWEYDKGPDLFFRTLIELKRRGDEFELIVLGHEYHRSPPIFKTAQEELTNHIIHWGWVESREEYINLLSIANVLMVTNIQDFFGISIIEAIAAGCYPLLPDRLAYPEHIPVDLKADTLYRSDEELLIKVEEIIESRKYVKIQPFVDHVQSYDWNQMSSVYDDYLEEIIK